MVTISAVANAAQKKTTLSQFCPTEFKQGHLTFEKFSHADQQITNAGSASQCPQKIRIFSGVRGQIQEITPLGSGTWMIQLEAGTVSANQTEIPEFDRATLQLTIDAELYSVVDCHSDATSFKHGNEGMDLAEITFRAGKKD